MAVPMLLARRMIDNVREDACFWGSDKSMAAYLRQRSVQEICHIGGGLLGTQVCKELKRHEWQFGGLDMTAAAVSAVCAILEDNDDLSSLGLGGAYLSPEAGETLALRLRQWNALSPDRTRARGLQQLDLAGLRFEGSSASAAEAMISVAFAVRENVSLAWVRVDGMYLPAKDVGRLSAWIDVVALKEGRGRVGHSLAFAGLGWRSALIIGSVLDVGHHQSFCLAGNKHLDEDEMGVGIDAIASALTFKRDCLTELNLAGTFLSAKGAERLADALEYNTSIVQLTLDAPEELSFPEMQAHAPKRVAKEVADWINTARSRSSIDVALLKEVKPLLTSLADGGSAKVKGRRLRWEGRCLQERWNTYAYTYAYAYTFPKLKHIHIHVHIYRWEGRCLQERSALLVGRLLALHKGTLTSLDLSNNLLGPAGGARIALAISSNRQLELRVLALRSCCLSRRAIEILVSAKERRTLPKLRVFDILENHIALAHAKRLAAIAAYYNKGANFLDSDEAFHLISKNDPDAEFQNLDDGDTQLVASELAGSHCLIQSMKMSFARAGGAIKQRLPSRVGGAADQGGPSPSEPTKRKGAEAEEGMAFLDLGRNASGRLMVLSLRAAGLNDVECCAFLTTFDPNGTVERLDLGDNQLNERAGAALVTMLKTKLNGKSTLSQLCLDGNSIGDDAVRGIVKHRQACSAKLLYYHWDGRVITADGIIRLRKAPKAHDYEELLVADQLIQPPACKNVQGVDLKGTDFSGEAIGRMLLSEAMKATRLKCERVGISCCSALIPCPVVMPADLTEEALMGTSTYSDKLIEESRSLRFTVMLTGYGSGVGILERDAINTLEPSCTWAGEKRGLELQRGLWWIRRMQPKVQHSDYDDALSLRAAEAFTRASHTSAGSKAPMTNLRPGLARTPTFGRSPTGTLAQLLPTSPTSRQPNAATEAVLRRLAPPPPLSRLPSANPLPSATTDKLASLRRVPTRSLPTLSLPSAADSEAKASVPGYVLFATACEMLPELTVERWAGALDNLNIDESSSLEESDFVEIIQSLGHPDTHDVRFTADGLPCGGACTREDASADSVLLVEVLLEPLEGSPNEVGFAKSPSRAGRDEPPHDPKAFELDVTFFVGDTVPFKTRVRAPCCFCAVACGLNKQKVELIPPFSEACGPPVKFNADFSNHPSALLKLRDDRNMERTEGLMPLEIDWQQDSLELDGGVWTVGSLTLLFGTLCSNDSLTDLSLRHLNINHYAQAASDLSTMIGVNTTLRRLDLRGSCVGTEMYDEIAAALEAAYDQRKHRTRILIECDLFDGRSASFGWDQSFPPMHEMSPTAAKLLFLSMQSPDFIHLRELVIQRPITMSAMASLFEGLHEGLSKVLGLDRASRASRVIGTEAKTYDKELLKVLLRLEKNPQWKGLIESVSASRLGLAPSDIDERDEQLGQRIKFGEHVYWMVGAPDGNDKVLLVRTLSMLMTLVALLVHEGKILPMPTLATHWIKGIEQAQKRLPDKFGMGRSYPKYLCDGSSTPCLGVLDTMCASLHSRTESSTHRGATGQLRLETLIVDGNELPLRTLLDSTLSNLDLSQVGVFGLRREYKDRTGSSMKRFVSNIGSDGHVDPSLTRMNEKFAVPLRALSTYVIGKLLSQSTEAAQPLRSIDLSNNDLCNVAEKVPEAECHGFGALCLALCVPRCSKLRVLRLACCRLHDKAAVLLANALRNSASQRREQLEVHLNGNAIGEEGAVALAEACAMEVDAKVMLLDLSSNDDGSGQLRACEAFRAMLTRRTSLRKLALTGPDGPGARALFSDWEALAGGMALTSLKLEANARVKMQGSEPWTAVTRSSQLTKLSVLSHRVGDWDDWLSAFEKNTSLVCVDMMNTDLGADLKALQTRLKKDTMVLKQLRLVGTDTERRLRATNTIEMREDEFRLIGVQLEVLLADSREYWP